jgi:hypothetical protein
MLYLERIPPIATLFSMRVAKIVDMLVDLGSAYLSGTLSESLFRKMLLYNKVAVREESLLTSSQMKAVILQSFAFYAITFLLFSFRRSQV